MVSAITQMTRRRRSSPKCWLRVMLSGEGLSLRVPRRGTDILVGVFGQFRLGSPVTVTSGGIEMGGRDAGSLDGMAPLEVAPLEVAPLEVTS